MQLQRGASYALFEGTALSGINPQSEIRIQPSCGIFHGKAFLGRDDSPKHRIDSRDFPLFPRRPVSRPDRTSNGNAAWNSWAIARLSI